MPAGKDPGPSIKDPKKYEALKNKRGMSKTQAAKISNGQAAKGQKSSGGSSRGSKR